MNGHEGDFSAPGFVHLNKIPGSTQLEQTGPTFSIEGFCEVSLYAAVACVVGDVGIARVSYAREIVCICNLSCSYSFMTVALHL